VCASSGTHGKIQNQGFFWPKSVRDTLMADDPFAPPSHDPNHYVNDETTFHFVLVESSSECIEKISLTIQTQQKTSCENKQMPKSY